MLFGRTGCHVLSIKRKTFLELDGFNEDGLGAVVNSSRGIDYAYVSSVGERNFKPEVPLFLKAH